MGYIEDRGRSEQARVLTLDGARLAELDARKVARDSAARMLEGASADSAQGARELLEYQEERLSCILEVLDRGYDYVGVPSAAPKRAWTLSSPDGIFVITQPGRNAELNRKARAEGIREAVDAVRARMNPEGTSSPRRAPRRR